MLKNDNLVTPVGAELYVFDPSGTSQVSSRQNYDGGYKYACEKSWG